MPKRHILILATLVAAPLHAQSLDPTPAFDLTTSPLTITQPALPNHPFTVTGRGGAILGMQDGTVELWQLPVKLFSALHLTAEVEGYPVPIQLNPLAATLEVSPGHTTLTYAHAAITVRQHMFVPTGEATGGKADAASTSPAARSGIIFFEIHAIHPATLTVSLTPSLQRMWPAPQWGQPGWDWRPLGTGGAFVLGTDNPGLFAMIAMPSATPGDISPYQEHPHTLPLAFRVHFDPTRDAHHLFPLLTELALPGETNTAAGQAALQQRLLATAAALPTLYANTQAHYAHFFDTRTTVHTPDPHFDAALRWAELSINDMQATIPTQIQSPTQTPSSRPEAAGRSGETPVFSNARAEGPSPNPTQTPAETGLVAGWFPSFDSARPGFGWFFGRDTLWTTFAINSYGDPALTREALEFLIRRQRADGKMPHEFSQTAGMLTGDMAWANLPYEYAAADATPLFLLAMADYVHATGDLAFLRTHWPALQNAFRFERTHDTDGDGVYDNAQGTGWVESWPPKLPHQELYLAALDRDATAAMAQLATWHGDPALATEALATAAKLNAAVAAYRLPNQRFAFSRNADGTYDPTLTIYPAVALWSHADGLPDPGPMLQTWNSALFQTDWGTRALSATDPAYDPISYHQGTVWPLFTGWSAMAGYRSGHPLAAYAALRRNVDLTWAQDPGAVTEVLSGRFYEPLGRSSTHQLWSSAMVLAPALRGLFGLEPDALTHTLLVHPHLPPTWDTVTVDHLHLGDTDLSLTEQREGAHLHITATSAQAAVLCLSPQPDLATAPPPCRAAASTTHTIDLPLPPLELSLAPQPLPIPGSETAQPHVLDEHYGPHSTELTLEAPAGTTVALHLRRNGTASRAAHTADGTLTGDDLAITLPAGTGFTTKHLTLSW